MATKKTNPVEKLGLGLSGGGFRASFFHIGLLAQMADQGILRYVEVISTVSGGSIIGALYYLHVKKFLESTADADIQDADYVKIVQDIERDFLCATEKNIRMSTFTSFTANFSMVMHHYSRSDRIGELYNDLLYQRVLSSGVANPIEMQNLKIFPKDDRSDFKPQEHNKARLAKVPILVLNATSLNTGRVWQFTAQTMGEPPNRNSITDEIDKKPLRLRRADSYANMTTKPINQQTFPLGHAVAASACVPVLFDPMSVSDLYFNRADNETIRVQLVDGGVVDNQGVESLMYYGCTSFIISDASGQMATENSPSVDGVPVALRVNSILQDRVRTEGLLHLIDGKHQHNVAFISLREGLGSQQVGWIDKDTVQVPDEPIASTSQNFGVHPDVQDSLSKMRTDLDAFTEVEAYSLMMDAYLMSARELAEFKATVHHRGIQNATPITIETSWQFLGIKKWLATPTPDYSKQLKVAQATFGKAMLLFPWLWIPATLLVLGLVSLCWQQILAFLAMPISVSAIVAAGVLWLVNKFAANIIQFLPILELLRPHAVLTKAIGKVTLLTIGTVFVILYLWIVNPLFLGRGRLSKLK